MPNIASVLKEEICRLAKKEVKAQVGKTQKASAQYRRDNRIAPTFENRFARMEYVGDRLFNLAYFRHTGEWWTIHKGLTLDECLELIGEDGPFSLS